jgi:Grx4 family monothiol glutaredoxin
MTTVLRTLAASYPPTTPPATSWLSINAEDLPDVSDAYDVTAVPFLVLVRNGTVLDTVSGSDAARVRTAIEKHAEAGAKREDDEFALPPKQPVTHRDTAAAGPAVVAEPVKTDVTVPEAGAPKAGSKEELHRRLGELVKAAPVMLFMKGTPSAPQCGFSRQLVALLRENAVRYGFFNILADDEVRQGLKEFADWPTFPQLWVGGELVGGLDIVGWPC